VAIAASERDDALMVRALALAADARDAGDVPVGALVADAEGRVIGEGRNLREATHDPTAHAEVVALRRAAGSLGSWNLEGCTLVVTLEPCLMCAGALLQAHVSRLVFGAWDEKAGAAGSLYDVVRDRRLPYRAEVVAGVRADAATALLQEFFGGLRR
jgi:tRNA(adenine34) deaminase